MAFTLFSDIIKKMLEKKEKNLYYDAHFHLSDCIKSDSYIVNPQIAGVSCAHSVPEWEIQKKSGANIFKCFGIHPQNLLIQSKEEIEEIKQFLKMLLLNNEIVAIGESGFDFFTDELKALDKIQTELWEFQLHLAIQYKKSLIIHCRKANEKLFEYSSSLAKLPSVLFHSFMGTSIEARSLLNKGINGFFSFGNQIIKGNKKVLDCIVNLPIERLLLETDAPFQTLEKSIPTKTSEIINIYEAVCSIKNNLNNEDFCKLIQNNFNRMFESNLK